MISPKRKRIIYDWNFMPYDKTIDICVKSEPVVPVRRSMPYQNIGRRKYEHPIYSWLFHEFWDQEINV